MPEADYAVRDIAERISEGEHRRRVKHEISGAHSVSHHAIGAESVYDKQLDRIDYFNYEMRIFLLLCEAVKYKKQLVVVFAQLADDVSLKRIRAHLFCAADIGEPESAVFELLADSRFLIESLNLVFRQQNVAHRVHSRYGERKQRHPPFYFERDVYSSADYKDSRHRIYQNLRVIREYALIQTFVCELKIFQHFGVLKLFKPDRRADIQYL